MYLVRSQKRLLQHNLARMKLVKRGTVSRCFSAALNKSCFHSAAESIDVQALRLKVSGFPTSIVSDLAECMFKSNQPRESRDKQHRPAAVPNMHRISHSFKTVASQYDVRVVLSTRDKLRSCPKINSQRDKADKSSAGHAHKNINCDCGVVYEAPLSCGEVYVGQTGRCVNIKLREHELSLKYLLSGQLA